MSMLLRIYTDFVMKLFPTTDLPYECMITLRAHDSDWLSLDGVKVHDI